MEVVRLSSLSTGRLYPTGNIPGTHFYYRLSRPQGHSAIGKIMSMKNSNPRPSGCSAVPQPTAPPRAPHPTQNITFVLTVCLQTSNRRPSLLGTLTNTRLDRTLGNLHILVFLSLKGGGGEGKERWNKFFTYLIQLSVFETSKSKYHLLDRTRSTGCRITHSVDTVYMQCEILFCYQNHAGELCVSANTSSSGYHTVHCKWPVCVKLTINRMHNQTAT